MAVCELACVSMFVAWYTSRYGAGLLLAFTLLVPLVLLGTDRSQAWSHAIFRRLAGRINFTALTTTLPALALLLAILFSFFAEPQATHRHAASHLLHLIIQILTAAAVLYAAFAAAFVGYFLFAAWISRSLSVLAHLVIHPVESLAAVPNNWSWYALHSDLLTPVELLPGLAKDPDLASKLSVRTIAEDTFEGGVSFLDDLLTAPDSMRAGVLGGAYFLLLLGTGVLLTVVGAASVALVYVSAYTIRLSVKATTFVYLPFLLATRDVRHQDPEAFFQGIRSDSAARVLASLILVLQLLSLPAVASVLVVLVSSVLDPQNLTLFLEFLPVVADHEWDEAVEFCGAVLAVACYWAAVTRTGPTDPRTIVSFPVVQTLSVLQVCCSLLMVGLAYDSLLRLVTPAEAFQVLFDRVSWILAWIGGL